MEFNLSDMLFENITLTDNSDYTKIEKVIERR